MDQEYERMSSGDQGSQGSGHHQDLQHPDHNAKGPPAPSKPQAKPGTQVRVFVRNIFGKTIPKQTLTIKNPSTGQIFSPVRSGEGWLLNVFGKVSDLKLTITGDDALGGYADDIVLLRLNSDGTADQMPTSTFFNTLVKNEGGSKPARVRVDVTMSRLKEIALEDVTDTKGKGNNFQEFKKVPCVPSPRTNLANNFRLQFGSTSELFPVIFVFDVVHLSAPFRIGVAMRQGLFSPSKILLFFHPPANLAGLTSADPYPTAYNDIMFRYVSGNSPADKHLAYQLSESGRDLAMVFPLGHVDNGMGAFSKNPAQMEEVLLEVLAHFRRRFSSEFKLPKIDALAVASFSAGIKFTLEFLGGGGKLVPLVEEVYDYDGAFSNLNIGRKFPPSYAPALRTNGRRALIYTQNPTGAWQRLTRSEREFPLPFARWKNVVDPLPPPNADQFRKGKAVHQLIPRYMLLHSLKMSNM